MQVRVYATLRDLVGQSRLSVETTGASTVGDELEAIASTYPVLDAKLWDTNRNLSGFVTVLLNGRSVDYLQGTKTPVTDADVISLFPPVGGGAGTPARTQRGGRAGAERARSRVLIVDVDAWSRCRWKQ